VIPVVLLLSGNYTWQQIVAGLGVGAGTGLFIYYCLVMFWIDRVETLSSSRALNGLGYHGSVAGFYGQRLHLKNATAAKRRTRRTILGPQNSAEEKIYEDGNLMRRFNAPDDELADQFFIPIRGPGVPQQPQQQLQVDDDEIDSTLNDPMEQSLLLSSLQQQQEGRSQQQSMIQQQQQRRQVEGSDESSHEMTHRLLGVFA